MNKKKSTMAVVIGIFIIVALVLVYIFSELYTESDYQKNTIREDAIKFKTVYESVNDKTFHDKDIRDLTVPKNNPFIFKTEDEIVKAIDNKETFIVYFGFEECPWCRSVLLPMIASAKKKGIKDIYYVNVLNIRDTFELDKKNKAVRTKEGTKGYYELLKRLDNVLEDYSPLTYKKKKKEHKVKINEKRIYAPNVVIVKEGKATALESGISECLTDPYMEITDKIYNESLDKFNCFFDSFKEAKATCEAKEPVC